MRYLILPGGLALAFVIGLLLIVTPAQADGTITVTTTSDAVASDGLCSLREAIIAADTDSAFSDCPAGSGADTIVFDSGLLQPATFVLTNTGANEDGALTGDLDIVGTLTISGTGTTIIDGNGTDRVFQIHPGARATIDGVTIRHGNPGSADGGGVAVDLTGWLTLTNSTVTSNTAVGGGGVKVLGVLTMSDSAVAGNQGGGIRNDGGRLTLTNVQVISNSGGYGVRNQNQASLTFNGGLVSGNQGGGIYNATSPATLNDLIIANNTGGGGVYNTGANLSHLTLHRSAVMTNTATSGAGVSNQGVGAIANIYDTRISGNNATAAGGGIFNSGIMAVNRSTIDHNHARSGGGIEHFGGSLHLINDTVSGNTAIDNGGGIYNAAGVFLTNLTVYANKANGNGGGIFNDEANAYPKNTIIANNQSVDGNCSSSDFAAVISQGHNLDSDETCSLTAVGDIAGTDPMLGPLQNNGGATETHALGPGSPAIDAGDNAECPVTDQRSVTRPAGASCDIGAYEYAPESGADLSIEKWASPDLILAGNTITYTVSVENLGPNAAAGVAVTDVLPSQVSFISASGQGWLCSFDRSLIICGVNTLPVGAAPVISIKVAAPETSGTLTNTVTVGSNAFDPNLTNNSTSAQSVVRPAHSLHLPLIIRHTP